jgi:hypothetical protein
VGYSTSPKTLDRIREHLKPLEEGRSCSWTISDGAAGKFAYKVREALHIARLHSADFPALARAAETFRIIVKDPRTVVAEPKNQELEASVVMPSYGDGAPVGTDARSIIAEWEKQRPQKSIHFPEAALPGSELLKLFDWAEDEGWLLFVAHPALTLRRHEPELAEYSWRPEDLTEEPLDLGDPF